MAKETLQTADQINSPQTGKVSTSPEGGSPIAAPDMKRICERWMQTTDEGKEFLRSKLPQEVFFGAEVMPGNPMDKEGKPKCTVRHELGYFLTKPEAEEGMRNRSLQVVSVPRAE